MGQRRVVVVEDNRELGESVVEILEMFDVPPSRIVGELKEEIKEAILDGRIANDREQALELLREIANVRGLAPRSTGT